MVERSADRLSLTFRLSGDLASVRLPEPAPRGRADELWRHTCLEAFVAPGRGETYVEINLSPAGQWATYSFDSYRAGMAAACIEPEPFTGAVAVGPDLKLQAEVDLASLGELASRPWRLGLAAVIEAADGTLSYWALAHPPGRPDFHRADCFALEVPAPQAT
ncbi:MAG TPA: DOMON-like domain-containing protein [Phenylobacterium sp.]